MRFVKFEIVDVWLIKQDVDINAVVVQKEEVSRLLEKCSVI